MAPWRHWKIYWREVFFNAFSALYRQRGDENSWDFNRISILISHLPLQVSQLALAQGRRDPRRGRGGRRHRARDADDSLELLQVAENGRYKVVAKAEPYKNLPVNPTCLPACCSFSFGRDLWRDSYQKIQMDFYLAVTAKYWAAWVIHQQQFLHFSQKYF